jgi:HK97 family phage major capsid protein
MFPIFSSTQTALADRALQMQSPFGDLTPKEVMRYSLGREMRRIISRNANGSSPGFEAELTAAAFRARPGGAGDIDPSLTIVVPPQIFQRALATQPGAKGGYMVSTDVDTQLGVIDALRPLSAVLRAGAQSVSGFVYDVAAPRITGTATISWQGVEGTSVSGADLSLGQLSIVKKTIIAIVPSISEQLFIQAPRLTDTMLARELASAIASELDRVALQGAGGGQPLGVLNVPAVPTVSGTSLAVAGLLSFQRKLLDNNGQSSPLNFAYVTTPAVGELLAQRPNFATGTAGAVWQGTLAEGRILGAPAFATPNMATASMVGGDWTRLLIADFFDGVELSFQHAIFGAATIAARAMLTCDVAVEHPNAFVISTSIT